MCPPFPHAETLCALGACTLGPCDTDWADCDDDPANGCEVNWVNGDRYNCGGCNRRCLLPNVIDSTCAYGQCVITECKYGWADCNNLPGDGCETFLGTSSFHCGRCNNTCELPFAYSVCHRGECAVGQCNPGFANCDGETANGCEANLLNDVATCGSCSGCPTDTHATYTCVNGTCQVADCDQYYADCDGNPANGCEVDTKTSTQHCGSCNIDCYVANGEGVCVNGSCEIATCDAGYKNCDNAPFDGCDTAVLWDVTNCGNCNINCNNAPLGAPSCVNDHCEIVSCPPGFGDCDGNGYNGCETITNYDPLHCGSCRHRCHYDNGVGKCDSGRCYLGACVPGWGDCDAVMSNGCENMISSNITSCGVCGYVCDLPQATPQCFGGTCIVLACHVGWGDCNGVQTDGCEVSLRTTENCGGCGVVCASVNGHAGCSPTGHCEITCNAGWGNCDNNYANGCETDLTTNPNNCGACSKQCPGGVCHHSRCW